MNKYFKKGFTLIELLVVIAIIAILATLLILNLSGIKSKGRDTQRATAVTQIRDAVEQYFDDNGSYPANLDDPKLLKYFANSSVFPVDPLSPPPPATQIKYGYAVSGTKYQIWAQLENVGPGLKSDSDINGTSFGGKDGGPANEKGDANGKCTAGGFNCLFDVGQN